MVSVPMTFQSQVTEKHKWEKRVDRKKESVTHKQKNQSRMRFIKFAYLILEILIHP